MSVTALLTGGPELAWRLYRQDMARTSVRSRPARRSDVGGGRAAIDAMADVCRESGCREFVDQDELGAWPGRCDYIADRMDKDRRRCAACFLEHLRGRDLPPPDVCELARRIASKPDGTGEERDRQ